MHNAHRRQQPPFPLQTPRTSKIQTHERHDIQLPNKEQNNISIMALDEKQRKTLNQYYKELKKYNEKRKKDSRYWKQYYRVLKDIKYLIRYGSVKK